MSNPLEAQVAEHVSAISASIDLLPLVAQISGEICERLESGGVVYTFGNGGSAADAQHLAAELIGRYLRTRRPLPAVSLSTDPSVTTCIANDFGYDEVFARQITALAHRNDVVIAFSTSGRSPSVVAGLSAAQRIGALTILFTGSSDSVPVAQADRTVRIASAATARIQEAHLLLLHLLSELIDRWAAGEPA